MRLVALVMLIGCGRLGFDQSATTDALATIDTIVPAGLVAYYPMDSIDGSGTDDATGRGHRGHCGATVQTNCPAMTAGRIGDGFLFTGNERLQVDSAADLLTTKAFTIAVWLEPTAVPVDFACAATKAFRGGLENSWTICLDPAAAAFFATVAGMSEPLYAQTPITYNAWHHVAVRWTGSVKTIWINGVQSSSQSTTLAEFDGLPISIGGDLDVGAFTEPFVGRLDDLRIYDRALSDDELVQLAQ